MKYRERRPWLDSGSVETNFMNGLKLKRI
jgi:hypothetical protein